MRQRTIPDPFSEKSLKQVQLFLYLTPIVGVIPSLWVLLRNKGSREQLQVSRLSIMLALIWSIVYISLWLGAMQTSDVASFRLLFLNSLATSGYFLLSIGLMFKIWKGKSPRFFR